MLRFTHAEKGFDCRHAPCQHKKKGDHGINGGYWLFALVRADGNNAVSLKVMTSFYPATVPLAHRASGWPVVRDRITGSVVFHRGVLMGGEPCDFTPSSRCETELGGYLVCDEFAPLLGETFEPQSEAFWAKLQELLERWEKQPA